MNKNKFLTTGAIMAPVVMLGLIGVSVAYAQSSGTSTSASSTNKGQFSHLPLTDAQKSALAQARMLRSQGKNAEAQTLLQNAGLPRFGNHLHGDGPGGSRGRHGGGEFFNKAAHDAVENNDFTAWKTAMKDYPDQSVLTQDLFDKMVQVEKLSKEIRNTLHPQTTQ